MAGTLCVFLLFWCSSSTPSSVTAFTAPLLRSPSGTVYRDASVFRRFHSPTRSSRTMQTSSLYDATIAILSSWEMAPTLNHPHSRPLSPELQHAIQHGTHPTESQDNLGQGIFLTPDWRKAWYTYSSPPNHPNLIDPKTGYAEYEITDIEGIVPGDLVGILYRNGPGKFGVNDERVKHVLDADGLIVQITFPPPLTTSGKRKFTFRSRFVQTKAFIEEEKAGDFVYRGTFGTAPLGIHAERKGLNEDPVLDIPLFSKIFMNAFQTDIKNTANTHVISFGGKVLALFEAGLPHQIDPITLETIGLDDMEGTLPMDKMPVKLSDTRISPSFLPSFLNGAAHTAHPNVCPRTGNLVGWHWSQLVDAQSLQVTFTEWSSHNFQKVASSTFVMPQCELAPHDMALTENCILLQVNALKMSQLDFILGIKGPAAALNMDARAPVYIHVFPRPTTQNPFEPFVVEAPASFCIHYSHAYEDPETGHVIAMFSGWPPSDSKDFLGAWGGFAPNFSIIPPTFLFKVVIDPKTRSCVDLSVAPGASNVCLEHPVVHPTFSTREAKYVYAVGANVVGDSSAPCGYVRIDVEQGSSILLPMGTKNTNVDAYWFGTRYFAGEPIVVPKRDGDPLDERNAYLLGMIQDSVSQRSGLAIFDLKNELRSGPMAILWLKSSVPHGLHGCFAVDGGNSSIFC
jgi:all-trans-8'-apo-beta-carotenal 15,15'-oxygenase